RFEFRTGVRKRSNVTPEQFRVAVKLHGFRRLFNSVDDSPATRMTFLRLFSPELMVTEERGTFKKSAQNSMQASLARPSTGGAVKDNFSASPISPVMAFFLARGWTLIANVAPEGVS